jgi:ABC-type glutathione transport system ATPase component
LQKHQLTSPLPVESQEPTPYEAGQKRHTRAECTSPPAISIRGLTKRYGPLTALNDLNLDVGQGEIFGFLGLNGAGKTTAIRLLLDLLRPTSGKAFIFGYDCWTEGLDARSSSARPRSPPGANRLPARRTGTLPRPDGA